MGRREQQVIGGAVILHDGKALVLRRSDNGENFAGEWEFPAGKKEIGERLEDAIRRECLEETGLHIRLDRLFNYFEFGVASGGVLRDCTQINFLATPETVAPVTLSPEHTAYKWIGPEELDLIRDTVRRETLRRAFDGR
jgi:8-oxo-dGTP diphosphatase